MMDRTMTIYQGIADLSVPHRQMQWGGPFLFKDGFTAMPKKRAVFTVPVRISKLPTPNPNRDRKGAAGRVAIRTYSRTII